ncbi:hypothetical protein ACL90Y_05865 [Micrococcus luteus]
MTSVPSPAARRPASRRQPLALAVAVALGVLVGLLGTVLHLQLWAPAGTWTLPWGAVLALVLVGSTQLWWSRRSRSTVAGGLLGAVAFTAAWALQLLPGDDDLGLPWQTNLFSVMPGATAASGLWLLGLPLVVVAVQLVSAREQQRRPRSTAAAE